MATALMRALSLGGMKVQPYKVGPDYIDPGYHTAATGRCSRNLDVWMLGGDGVREMFLRSAPGADISVIEGVMGLYDGRWSTDEGSTAHVARLLRAPVLLVMDARSMARSAAAVVRGYRDFDPEVNLCGVILNRVGSERHFRMLTEAIESATGVPVLGRMGYNSGAELPERHLGLLPTAEKDGLGRLLDLLAREIREGVDLGRLVSLAGSAPEPPRPEKTVFPEVARDSQVRIGLVRDSAFNFYYQDGLDLLSALGAELVTFSSLEGRLPPGLDGLYLGGGFPEVFAGQIAANIELMDSVREACGQGMPVYAECGGMMFLSRGVTGFDGVRHAMAGVIPGETVMLKKRAGLGYVTAVSAGDSILAPAGRELRGHEFHYSVMREGDLSSPAYFLKKAGEGEARPDGYSNGSILASYLHINFAGCPREAENFINSCLRHRSRRNGKGQAEGSAIRL